VIAAACVPLTLKTVQESRDPNRSHSIDYAGTVLIAVVLVPLVLALSEGNDWGWGSLATIGCLVLSIAAMFAFVAVEGRVKAPLVNLQLLRNQVLVGATLAILIVAGAINALMYIISLYFQNPAALGMSALQAGLATLPAAAGMIAVTPLITPLAVKIGTRATIAIGFGLAAAGCVALAFVKGSWEYLAFVVPLIAIAVGLGLANGPASSASTASVPDDEVGEASGISNMARYIGAAVAVATISTVYNSVTNNHLQDHASKSAALASGLAAAAIVLAIFSAAGIALALLMARHRSIKPQAIHRAAAAAASSHTIPTRPSHGRNTGERVRQPRRISDTQRENRELTSRKDT
jgi:Na+/melibiose symporter-like transporter